MLYKLFFNWHFFVSVFKSQFSFSCFQSTYDYGKQLLQAALVLRRSLRYDLEPNHELSRRLNQAWKRFSHGINERTARMNKVHIFNRNADIVSLQP